MVLALKIQKKSTLRPEITTEAERKYLTLLITNKTIRSRLVLKFSLFLLL